MAVKDIAFSSGYITVTFESGAPRRYPIASVLRALDIPTGLTHTQVGAITTLANMFVLVIKAQIDAGVLDESIFENSGYTLVSITEAIEEMGGDYEKPDISVS